MTLLFFSNYIFLPDIFVVVNETTKHAVIIIIIIKICSWIWIHVLPLFYPTVWFFFFFKFLYKYFGSPHTKIARRRTEERQNCVSFIVAE